MALLEWDESYRLGIEHLDHEHKDLFECINALHAGCCSHVDAEAIEDCLARLHMRLEAHFALEEQTMRERRNPGYTEHKAEHDRFLDEIGAALADFDAAQPQAQLEALAERVKTWIIEHITTFDRQLVEGA